MTSASEPVQPARSFHAAARALALPLRRCCHSPGAHVGSALIAALLILIAGQGPAAAQTAVQKGAPAGERLAAAMPALLREAGAPGLVVAVASSEGRRILAEGLADAQNRRPMTAAAGFRLGEAAHLVLSVAALQMQREGRLALDRPLQQLIPATLAAPIGAVAAQPVRALLTQSAGLADYLDNALFYEALRAEPQRRWTPAALVGFAAPERFPEEDRPLPTGPGARMPTLTATLLLGEVLAAADRRPLADLIRARIAVPAGAATLLLPEPGTRPSAPQVAGAFWDFAGSGQRSEAGAAAQSGALGPGGMVATAADLLAFLDALFRREALLPRRAVETMATAGLVYGLGVEVAETRWGLAVGHTGAAFGHRVELFFLPEVDTAVVVLANAETSTDLAWRVLALWP